MKPKTIKAALLILFLSFFLYGSISSADTQVKLSTGQTVYVPIYSNVFIGSKALTFELAAMLSIRNIDLNNSMTITSIEYYDNDGNLLEKYIEKPKVLGPLASDHIFIKETDRSGGFGANFIVRWKSAKEINIPVIESVMIGTRSGQGVSFLSKGHEIKENTK